MTRVEHVRYLFSLVETNSANARSKNSLQINLVMTDRIFEVEISKIDKWSQKKIKIPWFKILKRTQKRKFFLIKFSHTFIPN